MEEKTDHSKGNVEVEGINVPEDNKIMSLLKKYKNKLGTDTVDSLLFMIDKGIKEEKVEDLNANNNKGRRSFKK